MTTTIRLVKDDPRFTPFNCDNCTKLVYYSSDASLDIFNLSL